MQIEKRYLVITDLHRFHNPYSQSVCRTIPFFDMTHQLITYFNYELLIAMTNTGMFEITDIEVEIIFEIIALFFFLDSSTNIIKSILIQSSAHKTLTCGSV